MSLTIERPAPLLDLGDMLAREELPLTARKRGWTPQAIARTQGLAGRSWGLRDAQGACVAAFGLFRRPGEPETLEAWFLCRPEARRHMLAIARLAQWTAAAVREDAPVAIVANVAAGHRPGERLAAAIGFRPGELSAGFREWVL